MSDEYYNQNDSQAKENDTLTPNIDITFSNTIKPKEASVSSEKQDSDHLIELLEKKMKRLHRDYIATFTVNTPESTIEDLKGGAHAAETTLPFEQQSLVPKEMKRYLDRYVIGQEEAKRRLSVAVCDHLNYIKYRHQNPEKASHYIKQNIMMYGPTGVGKTYLVQCIAKYANIPFVKSDATKFTESGYMGNDVEETVRMLYHKAKSNKKLAEIGIVFIDEIDKIAAEKTQSNRDIGGKGVQNSLLKLLDETDVQLSPPWDMQNQLKAMMGKGDQDETINTKNILFIGSGVFQTLQESARKRKYPNQYGFIAGDTAKKTVQIEPEDFVQSGFEREFVGRFPVQMPVHPLTEKELFAILKDSEASILKHMKETFSYYNSQLNVMDCALAEIAKIAHSYALGARSLAVILDQTLTPLKYDSDQKEYQIDRAYIQDKMSRVNGSK